MSQEFRHQDPYRVARKPTSQEEYESPTENYHSRTASESSTQKLAEAAATTAEDPYERKKHKKKRIKPATLEYEKRANSYLPYSNHNRDPYNTESIYLQEDRHTRGPVGSILQDNIAMDMMSHDSFYLQETDYSIKKQNTNSALIPAVKKKKWWRKGGLIGKKLVFIVFIFIAVVAVIWYFVWPRTPTLQFLDAGLLNESTANYTSTSMVASWQVNFTVINSDNWIPTNIHNLAINVVEETTGVVFGSGNSGALKLSGRSIDQVISVPIQINFVRNADDATLKTLINACRIINRDISSIAPKQTLEVKFSIVYYIAGIVWHPSASVAPQSYFQCP